MAVLDLSDILSIVVNMPAVVAAAPSFSLGLILSENSHITPAQRVKVYSSTAAMIADGFSSNDPEVKAAAVYFEQSPAPTQVAVGNIFGAASLTVTNQTQGSATLSVSSTAGVAAGQSIAGTGIPANTTISAIVNGTTLTLSQAATSAATSGTVSVAAETPAQALAASREANANWYGIYMIGAADADIEALAAAAESTTNAAYFYDTSDATVLAGSAGNVAATLQASSYNHTVGIYSTTPYAGAALMGYVSGSNNGTYASFTLADKTLVGVAPEPINSAQLIILENQNINVYSTRFARYTLLELGVSASGADFGDIVGLDILVQNIQSAVMSLRMSSTKVPYTDAGMAQYSAAITQALTEAYTAGFLAAGAWEGNTVGNLTAGTMMAQGFSVQTTAISAASSSDKAQGIAPPVYICIYRAGNIRKVVLTVNVSQ